MIFKDTSLIQKHNFALDSGFVPWNYWYFKHSRVDGDKVTPNDYRATRCSQSFKAGQVTDWDPVNKRGTSLFLDTDPALSQVYPVPSFRAPVEPYFTDSYSRARSALFSEMKKRNWSASLFIAESKESWHMIRSAATRLYQAQRALRKGNLALMLTSLGVTRHRYKNGSYPTRKTVQANMSGYWLEAQLGWKPLLQDMHDGAKAIAGVIANPARPPLLECKGRGTISALPQTATVIDPDVYHKNWTSLSTLVTRSEVGVLYRASNEAVSIASSFGFTNPMSVVWEVIPMSFVVDYVIGISDYLENLTAFHGFEFHSGWHTCKEKTRFERVYSSNGPVYTFGVPGSLYVPIRIVTKYGSVYRLDYSTIQRNSLTAFPAADIPRFDYLFKKDRLIRQSLNVLSLFAQFKSK